MPDDEPGGKRGPFRSSQDLRQGEIVLRSRLRRTIFLGGLIAFAVAVLVLTILGAVSR